MLETRFYKLVILVNGAIPLAMLLWDWRRGNLGANPVEYVLSTTGVLTLSLVLITLLVSPLRAVTGKNDLIRYRRVLGLYAFFCGCVHLVTYSIFDKGLEVAAIVKDIGERPFIAVGMAALALMMPLAVTSTNGMIKRLGGKRWQLLHRSIYLIGILGVVHYYLIQKSDFFWPIVFGIILAILLGFRVYSTWKKKRREDPCLR